MRENKVSFARLAFRLIIYYAQLEYILEDFFRGFTMDFKISDTNRGKKSLICDGYIYRIHAVLKCENISWQYKKDI